jgi:hypothetical protein
LLTEEAEPTTREPLGTTSTEANLDVVAQIKSSLLEMPELVDDNMSFGNAPCLYQGGYPVFIRTTLKHKCRNE